ncbi:MAG: bifunctional oligoribonuclease/PAP phosphatase NrnA [Lachnospiraceae bacterium]|nr:bifunctional oligoribonuclease/PAP phosphatase NrnA [Lachnospiraceae bacterium]
MKSINELIGDAKTVAISGHIRPDGDCVGSCMALYNYIKDNFPQVDANVYLEYVDKKFLIIKNADKIITTGYDNSEVDVFFALDSGDVERLGINAGFFEHAKRTVCVDHHISNEGFADDNYILPKASSACEALYDLLDEDLISKETAEALYMGIAHDSGGFRYSNTSPKTMNIAAKMIEKGVNVVDILEDTFFMKTFEQQKILGKVLASMVRLCDGKCLYGYVTNEMMDECNVTTKELGHIVGEIRNVQDVECTIFMYQSGENSYKVSLRSSKYVDVSAIAVKYGGGGHIRAAGVDMEGSREEIFEKIMADIKAQL